MMIHIIVHSQWQPSEYYEEWPSEMSELLLVFRVCSVIKKDKLDFLIKMKWCRKNVYRLFTDEKIKKR